MFRPADRDDLLAFLEAKPADVPVTVLGVASNVLIRDGGLPGVTLRLGRGFADIVADGNDILCGAAALDINVAPAARRSEEHTSELQSLMRISYAVFCLKKKKHIK